MAQHKPEISVYERNAKNEWEVRAVTGLDQLLTLVRPAVSLPTSEIYRRIDF